MRVTSGVSAVLEGVGGADVVVAVLCTLGDPVVGWGATGQPTGLQAVTIIRKQSKAQKSFRIKTRLDLKWF
jgi:hypothetical protein